MKAYICDLCKKTIRSTNSNLVTLHTDACLSNIDKEYEICDDCNYKIKAFIKTLIYL